MKIKVLSFLSISVFALTGCNIFYTQEYPQLCSHLSEIKQDSVFSFIELNNRNWDRAYIIKPNQWCDEFDDITMTESVKKYFINATSNDTVSILFFTINNRLNLFTKVNARSVNLSTISKSVINRKDRFVMRKNRNIELYGPDIFHDYNAKDFFIKDIHQMHKEL